MSARTPKEIFQHHAEAMEAVDLNGIATDYSEDAILITTAGVVRGKAGIRQAFEKMFSVLLNAKWDLKTHLFEDDILFLEWTADTADTKVSGVDTFVFKDGFIRAQTVSATIANSGKAHYRSLAPR